MIDVDELFNDIVTLEDELTLQHNTQIENEVREKMVAKYGQEAVKFLDKYYSDDDRGSDADCDDCKKRAQDLIDRLSVVEDIVKLASDEEYFLLGKVAMNDKSYEELSEFLQKRIESITKDSGIDVGSVLTSNQFIVCYLMNFMVKLLARKEETHE